MKRGVAFVVAWAILWAVLGCSDVLFEEPGADTGRAVYEELWQAFDQRYAPFAERGVDWDVAFQRHLPDPAADRDAVFAAATSLLAELDDGHVTLLAPGRPAFVSQRTFREDTFQDHLDLGVILARMVEGPHRLGAARYGILPNDIAYVHIAHWNDPIPDLDLLLDLLQDRQGVIVDLRHNPGGDFTNGFPFAGRFADERRLAFTTLTKTGPGRGALGQRVEWHVEPGGPFQYQGPVVVLTNGFTNSAAERTLLAFRALPSVTVVGSRSAGNHGEKVGSELSNGWRYTYVPQLVVAADGTSYEGAGVPPDIEVANLPSEVGAGIDRQLEAALVALGGT